MCIYYLIFTTYRKIPLFSSDKIRDILVKNIYFYVKKYHCNLYAYSILPCHINLVLSFKYIGQYLEFEHDFKSYTYHQIIKLTDQNKINDYNFICGTDCGCRKISYYGPLPPKDRFTEETLEIIRKRKRIWRAKCWSDLILSQKKFDKLVNYAYLNPVKHNLVLKEKIDNYKYTFRSG